MTEVVAYALLCGFALSEVLVPVTAFALRRAANLGGAARHAIWFMVLLASVAAPAAAFVASSVRPAVQFSGVVVSPVAAAPDGARAAGLPLAALGGAFLVCWLRRPPAAPGCHASARAGAGACVRIRRPGSGRFPPSGDFAAARNDAGARSDRRAANRPPRGCASSPGRRLHRARLRRVRRGVLVQPVPALRW